MDNNIINYKNDYNISMDNIVIMANKITIDEYLSIRTTVNWKHLSKEQAELALTNSLITVGAYESTVNNKRLVGMGRVVGDGAVICYVQDLIVLPEYQSKGIGSRILETLTEYVESIKKPDTEMMFCLMCAKGREKFYKKHGFIERPTENLGPGMIQYLK